MPISPQLSTFIALVPYTVPDDSPPTIISRPNNHDAADSFFFLFFLLIFDQDFNKLPSTLKRQRSTSSRASCAANIQVHFGVFCPGGARRQILQGRIHILYYFTSYHMHHSIIRFNGLHLLQACPLFVLSSCCPIDIALCAQVRLHCPRDKWIPLAPESKLGHQLLSG